MVLKTLLAAVLLTSPAAAFASVSVDCFVMDLKNSEKVEFQITLNENNNTATYMLPGGKVVWWKAIFTPTKVVFADAAFIIDRVTMAFERRNVFGGTYLGTDFGKCVLSTTKTVF